MRKRFTVLSVLLALLCLAGCGKTTSGDPGADPAASQTAYTTTLPAESAAPQATVSAPDSTTQTTTLPGTAPAVSDAVTDPSAAAPSTVPTAPAPPTASAATAAATTVTAAETTVAAAAPVGSRMLSGVKIGLDPGHQDHANTAQEAIAPGSSETKYKVTGGAQGVSTKIPEYVTVLEIAQKLRGKLEALGATVYMTRETHDVDLSNQERAKMMNRYGVDLVLRIHCDSATNESANGIGLFVSRSNSIAAQSRAYAETILPIVSNAVGAKNNGVTQNDNYTGQNWSEVPCIMVECGYLSNPSEDVLLNSDDYQEKLTDGLLQGIVACFATPQE